MPPRIALYACFAFIAWLFYRDYRSQEKVSPALLIPLLWLFFLGSRPISLWFGFDASDSEALEGSPLDRLSFLILMGLGVWVLARRNISWATVVRHNQWLFIFFLYLGLSVLWSDYSAVSFKRWLKDLGNVIMVLVVLSDQHPLRAAKVLLVRCCYLLIPLSVLFIKYFPELGRSYDRWAGTAYYCGVATDKNTLGMNILACALTLLWILLNFRWENVNRKVLKDNAIVLFLLVMALWLLHMAQCSTAFACLTVGGFILVAMRSSAVRKKLRWLGLLSVAVVLCLLFMFEFGFGEMLVQPLGRDLTFTGRTYIWELVLREDTNPLVGEGFYSFWLGDRNDRLSASYHYQLGTAHSGYLETYLNSGWIGVLLLAAVFLSAGKRIKWEGIKGEPFAAFRLASFIIVILYGVTESVFDRQNVVWFLFLLIIVEYPRIRGTVVQRVGARRNLNSPVNVWTTAT